MRQIIIAMVLVFLIGGAALFGAAGCNSQAIRQSQQPVDGTPSWVR